MAWAGLLDRADRLRRSQRQHHGLKVFRFT